MDASGKPELEVVRSAPPPADALRTRDGVVALDEFRRARTVRSFLETMYGASPLFHAVHVVAAKDGPGFEAQVWVYRDGPDVRRGLPASVDGIPLVIRLVDERAKPVPGSR